jgi:hypothetical protein
VLLVRESGKQEVYFLIGYWFYGRAKAKGEGDIKYDI